MGCDQLKEMHVDLSHPAMRTSLGEDRLSPEREAEKEKSKLYGDGLLRSLETGK